LLQLRLAPTALLHVKFLDESLNHNNVDAPLDPVVLTQAVDLPMPPAVEEPDEKDSVVAGKTPGSSAKFHPSKGGESSTPADKQKKLSKFFKNLGHKS